MTVQEAALRLGMQDYELKSRLYDAGMIEADGMPTIGRGTGLSGYRVNTVLLDVTNIKEMQTRLQLFGEEMEDHSEFTI